MHSKAAIKDKETPLEANSDFVALELKKQKEN